jgi:SAM-dependent methyltransferase
VGKKLFQSVEPSSVRRHAPATERNRDAILEILRRVFDRPGTVLEIASGTGEHAIYFAAALPHLTWQPSDRDPDLRQSIDAWAESAKLANLREAVDLDAAAESWPVEQADYLLCINMIHIAPPEAGEGLLRGAARVLPPGGKFVLYGPFREGGVHTAPSNERFDADLRARNPSWGVRNLDDVVAAAAARGLEHLETVRMPANNLTVVFRRIPALQEGG